MAERAVPLRLPAYKKDGVSVYLGDAREVMAELPAESVDCVVTSPPYWGLRDFGVAPTIWGGHSHCSHQWSTLQRGRRKDLLPSDLTTRAARVGIADQQDAAATNGGRFCRLCGAWLGSLGLEPSPQLFVAHLVDLFRGVRRLLKPSGVLWLNLGDTFYHAGKVRGSIREEGLKAKDLIGVPWRVALALQADGWFLRSDVIWHKPNPVPEPAIDRPVRAHEFLFLLSKRAHYFYDAEAVREPAVIGPFNVASLTPVIHGGKYERRHDPMVRGAANYARRRAPQSHDRNRHSVWTIPTEPFRGSHTATFPTRLVEPCILAGTSAAGCCSRCGLPSERVLEITYQPLSARRESRKGPGVFEIEMRQLRVARTTGWRPTCECGAAAAPAIVLDPFAGTGTALAVAKSLGRIAIGIELNPAYLELIKRRLSQQFQGRARGEEAA